MKGSIVEFFKNQEHLCAKVFGLIAVAGIFLVEFRGELNILPKEVATDECHRLREHLDSLTIDRYKHARHFAYDATQCVASLPEGVRNPLIFEILLPRLERDGMILGPHPDWSKEVEEINAQK